jgi:hypothetical protein
MGCMMDLVGIQKGFRHYARGLRQMITDLNGLRKQIKGT